MSWSSRIFTERAFLDDSCIAAFAIAKTTLALVNCDGTGGNRGGHERRMLAGGPKPKYCVVNED
jgi:hypothetical protein